MVGCLIRNVFIPAALVQNVIVAAPRVPNHIDATVESDGCHEQVFHHELVDSAAGHRVQTIAFAIVVGEVAVRVECAQAATVQHHCLLLAYVVSEAVSVCHGRNHELTCAQQVCQVWVLAKV